MLLHRIDHYDASPEFLQGYADAMRFDRKGQGKPCGKGFISESKKCSKKGAETLAQELKSSDPKVAAAAKKRVEIGKRNAKQRSEVKRQVEAATKKKRETEAAKPDTKRKKVKMSDLKRGLVEGYGAKSWQELKKDPMFQEEVAGLGVKLNTQEGLRKLYRRHKGRPDDEQNPDKNRPGVINGVDVKRNFLPYKAFGLDPKTATKGDIKKAFRKLSKKHHPDVGGDREVFERLQKMRASIEPFAPD